MGRRPPPKYSRGCRCSALPIITFIIIIIIIIVVVVVVVYYAKAAKHTTQTQKQT